MQTFRVTVPAPSDVDRITVVPDPVLRNLLITACYHDLSAAMSTRLGPVANWCTFATWASRQAGTTIRGEDLRLALEQRISPSIRQLAEVAERYSGDVARNILAIQQLIAHQRPLQRAADAVARGNLKVFAEIGREFARFLADGRPPDQPQRLQQAFRAYTDATTETDPRQRSQRVLYANLLIGYHEQTRLQPEIREALDSMRGELERLRPLLIQRLLPGWWQRARRMVGSLLGRRMPLDVAVDRLINEICDEARELLTAELMTLRLPNSDLRLGRNMPETWPQSLVQLDYAPLVELLHAPDIARTAPAAHERDWSEFPYRMFFIARLFRSHQERADLQAAPFADAQLAELRAGRVPPPPL